MSYNLINGNLMKKIYLVAIAVAALTVSSCSQDEVLNMNPEAGPQAISFNGAYLGNAAETRGTVATIDNLKVGTYAAGLGVFANYTGENEYATTNATNWTNTFMNNLNVKWTDTNNDGTADDWTYSPAKYWPSEGEKVSFVAYAPFVNGQTDAKAITHTVPATIANQNDLVVSNLVLNQTCATPEVSFTMSHVLSKIGLKMTGAELPNGYSFTLTSVKLGVDSGTGFYTSNSYNAVDGTGTWGTGSGTQALKWVSTDLSNDGKVTNATNNTSTSNDDDKFLFVIPQNFTSLPVRVEYDLTVAEGATMHYGFDGTITEEFEKGKAYLISFTMNYQDLPGDSDDKPVKITFEVTTVNGWDPATEGNNVTLTPAA